MTSSVAYLRSSADGLFPVAVHNGGAASGSLGILRTIGNCPVAVLEFQVGKCDVVGAYLVVTAVRPVVHGGIYPDEFANFVQSVACAVVAEGIVKSYVVEPHIP